MKLDLTHRGKALVFSVAIAIALQVPFAVLFFVPLSGLGPGPGVLFFTPSIVLVKYFFPDGRDLVPQVILCQVVITSIAVFWLITWRARSGWVTTIGLSCYISLIVVASALLIPYEQMRAARREATRFSSDKPVLGSIERVNVSLNFYRRRYGQYPASFEQLGFPPEGRDVSQQHAGLIQFPLPMEAFFEFMYTRRSLGNAENAGYQLYVDGKAAEGLGFYHYCSDETGSIRFSTNRQNCPSGSIVYAHRH